MDKFIYVTLCKLIEYDYLREAAKLFFYFLRIKSEFVLMQEQRRIVRLKIVDNLRIDDIKISSKLPLKSLYTDIMMKVELKKITDLIKDI